MDCAGGDDRRSIPACAGEPPAGEREDVRREVYPRVCGGTTSARRFSSVGFGLSPRVRGNPASCQSALSSARSIPACAGEPPAVDARPKPAAVYPRVCGGTHRGQDGGCGI